MDRKRVKDDGRAVLEQVVSGNHGLIAITACLDALAWQRASGAISET